MSENLAIFLIGGIVSILITIIAFFAKTILAQILSELKALRQDFTTQSKEINRDVAKINETAIKNRIMLQSLPCRNEGAKTCIALRN